MRDLQGTLSGRNWFLLFFIVFLVFFGYLQMKFTQADLFLAINRLNTPSLDTFFKRITFLGDGIFFGVVILLLLFKRYSNAALGVVIFLSTSVVAQFLKRVVFADDLRPFAELGNEYVLHQVDGVQQVMTLSFPSGHTTTAFALGLLLAWKVFPSYLGWFVGILAGLVGYSRVYLGQHYVEDIYAGAILGVVITFLIIQFLGPKMEEKFGERSVLNR